jgi:PAS domain S-box-containing protein
MTGFFDIRTISLVTGGVMMVLAASMACFLFNRRTYGNFTLWTLGMGSLSLGFTLISFRGMVPDMVSIVLANALIFFSFALIYLGFRALDQGPKKTGFHLGAMAVLSFAVFPFFTYVVPSPSVRISLISLTGALYFGLCARILEYGIKKIRIKENILLGSALILMTAALAAQGVYFLVPGSVPAGFVETGPFHGMTLFIITLVQITFVMGLMQLNSQLLEQDLSEKEKRLKKNQDWDLFAHAPAGICEVDFKNNRFIRINDIICRFSGYTLAELMAMNPFDLLTEESRNRMADRLVRLAAGHRETRNIEYEMITRENKRLSIAVTLDFADEDRSLSQTLVVIHDISWRKQLETEKIASQKLLAEQQKLALIGQVAGKMAHDFNNILAVLMGNIELLLMDYSDPVLQKKLKMMLSHTEKGQLLTRNLVAFAKTREPRQKYFSLNEKIDLSLALMKKDLQDICITRSYADALPEILADPGMIEHTLVNLLQNSIHALSKTAEPLITLKTFLRDRAICLEVKDNGCGIPRQHIADIFTPSFTLKGGRDVTGAYAPGIKGTGYGLSNIQKYVNQHKGSIFVTSEPGQGTCVTICFPVIEKQLTVSEKQSLAPVMVRPGMRILLVEDEPDIAHVQQRILTQEPCSHQVDVADDGRTAMDLFDRHAYDLVSLDYMLTGSLNGMDVYRHIRQTNTAIPVLFVSGNIEFIEEIKSLKEKDRQVAHLSKPCRGAEYVEAVHSLLTL